MALSPAQMKATQELLLSLREEHFLFTVKALGHEWDVYKIPPPHVPGQISLRLNDEGNQVIIGAVIFGEGDENKMIEEFMKGVH